MLYVRYIKRPKLSFQLFILAVGELEGKEERLSAVEILQFQFLCLYHHICKPCPGYARRLYLSPTHLWHRGQLDFPSHSLSLTLPGESYSCVGSPFVHGPARDTLTSPSLSTREL